MRPVAEVPATRAEKRERVALIGAVALATLFGAWLRLHGLASQLVLDDEWHALLELARASYGEIFRTFGFADHSIPLTLLYKAMAGTIGLDEVNIRAPQVACGILLIPFGAWLSWRASRDAAASALFSVLLAVAPFLVLYSRLARPYAITTLLVVAGLAMIWRWNVVRNVGWASGAAFAAALAAWLHPLTGVYSATACLFLFANDVFRSPTRGIRPAWQSFAFGAAVATAMLLPLVPPLVHDFASLWGKAGGAHAGFATAWRALAMFAGGFPAAGTALVLALAAAGAIAHWRRSPPLAGYMLVLALAPPLVIAGVGAQWSHQGHTFARYVFPLQVLLLFWASWGAITLARLASPGAKMQVAWLAAGALAVADVAETPTVQQVSTLGAWYGHIYHHFDYDRRYNRAQDQYRDFAPVEFLAELRRLPPRSVTVLEAPFSFEAPANPFAYFDLFSRQLSKAGMLGRVCLDPARRGEVDPSDTRFRFQGFVDLADDAAVRKSGARFLLLHREQIDGHPFPESAACIAALSRLYGPPVKVDARHAAWDLATPQPR